MRIFFDDLFLLPVMCHVPTCSLSPSHLVERLWCDYFPNSDHCASYVHVLATRSIRYRDLWWNARPCFAAYQVRPLFPTIRSGFPVFSRYVHGTNQTRGQMSFVPRRDCVSRIAPSRPVRLQNGAVPTAVRGGSKVF